MMCVCEHTWLHKSMQDLHLLEHYYHTCTHTLHINTHTPNATPPHLQVHPLFMLSLGDFVVSMCWLVGGVVWLTPGVYGWGTIGGSTHTGMCYILGIGTLVCELGMGPWYMYWTQVGVYYEVMILELSCTP